MSVERGIHLDVQVPDFGARDFLPDTRGGHPAPMQQPDEQATERFEAALAGQNRDADARGTQVKTDGQVPGSLFDLLGAQHRLAAPGVSAAPPQERVSSDWAQQMGESIERLMVDDGQNGSRQVRMQLKEEVLPGVTVAIQECEGRLQVDFICSVEASRLRLNQEAPVHARTLADRLQRDVLLRVQTDDEDDLCLLETLACT